MDERVFGFQKRDLFQAGIPLDCKRDNLGRNGHSYAVNDKKEFP